MSSRQQTLQCLLYRHIFVVRFSWYIIFVCRIWQHLGEFCSISGTELANKFWTQALLYTYVIFENRHVLWLHIYVVVWSWTDLCSLLVSLTRAPTGADIRPPSPSFFVDGGKTAASSAPTFWWLFCHPFYTLCASCGFLPWKVRSPGQFEGPNLTSPVCNFETGSEPE